VDYFQGCSQKGQNGFLSPLEIRTKNKKMFENLGQHLEFRLIDLLLSITLYLLV